MSDEGDNIIAIAHTFVKCAEGAKLAHVLSAMTLLIIYAIGKSTDSPEERQRVANRVAKYIKEQLDKFEDSEDEDSLWSGLKPNAVQD